MSGHREFWCGFEGERRRLHWCWVARGRKMKKLWRRGAMERKEGRGLRYGVVGVGEVVHVSNFNWELEEMDIKK